jgi:tRNA threonylcarbamoyladenosine biosynthesis protein TsaE
MTAVGRRRSRSVEETESLGASLAPLLREGDLVVLTGPLGAGKTRLAAGIARGLGARGRVRSPTYTLVSEHHGRLLLAHADLYRLAAPVDPASLGLDEYLDRGALVVEWGERLPDSWRSPALEVHLEFAGAEERVLEVNGRGPRGEELAGAWSAGWTEE